MRLKHFISSIVSLLMLVPAMLSMVFGLEHLEFIGGRVEVYLWMCLVFTLWLSWAVTKVFVGDFSLVPPAEIKALHDKINELSQNTCDECSPDDYGWNYNRVEGRVPCVCIAESEAYQEVESLYGNLVGLLVEVIAEGRTGGWIKGSPLDRKITNAIKTKGPSN